MLTRLQKLQRAIAEYRGVPYERVVGALATEGQPESGRTSETGQPTPTPTGPPETKRKYRRHPKPDENAPDRPPSAYVIFSNKIREEVKDQNLSFTRIAKLVGDRWQKLDPAGKEPYEAQANSAKERYNIQLSTYKKTDAYKEYVQYLADFKSKHGGPSEQKRPKLGTESSGGSISAKSLEGQQELLIPGQGHIRGGSLGSVSSSAYQGALPSPASFHPPQLIFQNSTQSSGSAFPSRVNTTSSRGGSPPISQLGKGAGGGQLSTQSSLSDESPNRRSESDPLGRTASLSLSTPPSGTPPLPPPQSSGSGEPALTHDISRLRYPTVTQPSTHSFGGIPSAFGQPFPHILPTPVASDPTWRGRGTDPRSFQESSRSWHPPPHQFPGQGSSVSLPPLINPERSLDIAAHRTLPAPRASPALQQQPSFPPPPMTESPHPIRLASQEEQLRRQSSSQPSLGRSESDAANALAGLATGEPRSDPDRPPDKKQS